MCKAVSFLLLTAFCCVVSGMAQESVVLTYSDYYDSGASDINIPALSKSKRVSKNAATISFSDSNLGDEIAKSVGYAVSVWESCI